MADAENPFCHRLRNRMMAELHTRATPARFPIVTDGGASVEIAYLEALVPVMRRLGVTSHGQTSLGPDPTATALSDEPEISPNERMKLAQRQEAERLERMRFGASGGPRPLGPDSR